MERMGRFRTVFVVCGLMVILNAHFVAHAQDSRTDSLIQLLSRSKEDSNKVNLLNQISAADIQSSSALDYAQQAVTLSDKIKYNKGKALAYKNIGLHHFIKSDFIRADENWRQAQKLYAQIRDEAGLANILNNLGSIQYNLGNLSSAIEFFFKSLEASQKASDTLRTVTALNNVGLIYMAKPNTHDLAIDYLTKALKLGERIKDSANMGLSYVNLGEVYYEQKNDSAALYNCFRAKELLHPNDEILPYLLNNIGKIYSRKGQNDLALKYHEEALAKATEIGSKLFMAQASLSMANLYKKQDLLVKSMLYFSKASDLALEIKAGPELQRAYRGLSEAYYATDDYQNAYRYSNLSAKLADSLYKYAADSMQLKYEVGIKEKQIDLLTKDKDLKDLELKRQKIAKNGLIAGLGLVFLIIGILYRDYRTKVKTNKLLDHQKAEIEGLLLNILPAEVATELQQEGNATPKYFEQASVLFTDFKGFTRMADALSPQEVVAALNECFMAFDDIIERNNLEKIKTIGDSYMCAGGIPRADPNHVMNIVRASFEILEFMRGWNKVRAEKGLSSWELRIGIHVGPVVAGVVGKKKYAYDIWGSTVNIASRMESAGEIGQVNISETLYELIKDQYDCSYRGKISAKNIGDIDMYFVNHLKTEVEEVELTKYAS